MKLPFDSVLFNSVRLQLVDILNSVGRVSFTELKECLEVTDGNLASHLRALERAKIITFEKSFVGRKPKTVYFLTTKGRNNLINIKEWFYQNFLEGEEG